MVAQLQRVRGGRFVDERLLFGRWRSEATRDEIEMFFRSLAINHGVQVPRPPPSACARRRRRRQGRVPIVGGGVDSRSREAGGDPGLARVRRYGGVWLHEGVAY